MKLFAAWVTVAAWLLLPVTSVNAAQTEGESLALYQPCVACHGAVGEGNVSLGAPALAGQDPTYLQRQLEHFKAGRRGSDPADTYGAQMKVMVAALSDADIPLIAAYLGDLPVQVVAATATGDLRNGNNYYQANCGACHGGSAEGNAGLNAPRLASLDATYLQRQFLNFQRGIRGADPADKYGRQMKMMSTTLPTEQHLVDVITFIQSLAVAQ